MHSASATVSGDTATMTALTEARERTRLLVAPLDDATLERQIDPLMSPLVWDLAHIAAYEDLWLVHRHTGAPLLHPHLRRVRDAARGARAGGTARCAGRVGLPARGP